MGTSGGNEPASQSWYTNPDEKKDPGVWTGSILSLPMIRTIL